MRDNLSYRSNFTVEAIRAVCYSKGSPEPHRMPKAVRKVKKNRKRIVVFGVFDLLHPGHVRFLTHAKQFGGELIVVVTQDRRVKQEKGSVPYHSAQERKSLLSALNIVDRVVLGDKGKRWTVIKRLNPHVIVLGPDQTTDHPQIQEQIRAMKMAPVIKQFPKPRYHKHASSSIRAIRHKQFHQGRSVP